MDFRWFQFPHCWISMVKQGTIEWTELKTFRPGGASIAACVGNSSFTTPDEESLEIARLKEKVFSEKSLINIQRGVRNEPFAADWYAKNVNPNILEVGFVIPKWDLTIGVSPDRLVGSDGLVEIKSPEIMYWPLVNKIDSLNANPVINKQPIFSLLPENYSHIWLSHLEQMQMQMAVCERQWCDYLVYCPDQEKVYLERIPFMKNWWEEDLYPRLKKFQTEKLWPLRKDSKYPIMPPS